MHKVAEQVAAERVVAQILNDGTAVGVGMSFLELESGNLFSSNGLMASSQAESTTASCERTEYASEFAGFRNRRIRASEMALRRGKREVFGR